MSDKCYAEVTAVYPDLVKISVSNLKEFKIAENELSVGSYLRISDSNDCAIIAIVDNFIIESIPGSDERKYTLEASPIGFLDANKKFQRGGNNIAIPPTQVKPATTDEIQAIYNQIETDKQFEFCSLARIDQIRVPVDGNKFFNKHVAIIGATGSGKSHTVSAILQKAKTEKSKGYKGLNNSHIILMDIHDEYRSAFPDANQLSSESLQLPYWLLNEEELEELLVETGENQAYNQVSLLRRIVTRNKLIKSGNSKVTFGTPTFFSIIEVVNCLTNLSRETVSSNNRSEACIEDKAVFLDTDEAKFDLYFTGMHKFTATKTGQVVKGPYNDGSLEKFISRIKDRIEDERLNFLFADKTSALSFESVLQMLLGYRVTQTNNVTIIDLSGIPFEVLSLTVSLISRLVFDYGYYCKRHNIFSNSDKTPFLIVYEEAHKYVPKNDKSRYHACRQSIERIAKEGRKYGVTLVIVSQRPSEISETIFSQCNNFVAMRLTNPDDQAYVRRLMPDSLGPLTETLSTLTQGEAVLIGDSVVMPSLVQIDMCNPEPSSSDIPYFKLWKEEWLEVNFKVLTEKWAKIPTSASKK